MALICAWGSKGARLAYDPMGDLAVAMPAYKAGEGDRAYSDTQLKSDSNADSLAINSTPTGSH